MDKKQDISVIVANPAGNITIFVLTPVAQEQYVDIAIKLLAIEELQGEQVGFIKNFCPEKGMDVSMEMSGLEFCGNASRSFALFLAKQTCMQGETDLRISVSGTLQPIDAYVDTLHNTAKISMPLPLSIETLSCKSLPIIDGTILIEFDGIVHLILEDIEASIDIFNSIKDFLIDRSNPACIGVMFYDTIQHFMTPVVYVKDINSTYFEGSCGSGTTALCIALSKQYEDGTYAYIIKQPKGTLHASIEKQHGKIERIYIDGPVSFGEIISLKI
jgi:diaminopimelate epimerase